MAFLWEGNDEGEARVLTYDDVLALVCRISNWLLAQGVDVVPIPGTKELDHLEENMGAMEVSLTPEVMATLDALINPKTVAGPRYNAAAQADIDTEELP